MRTFISKVSNTKVITVADQIVDESTVRSGRYGDRCKKDSNADKAYVLQGLADLFDFDSNESSTWSPAECNAIDEAFAFVNSAYCFSDADDSVGFGGDSIVFANLNVGRVLILRAGTSYFIPDSTNEEVVEPHNAEGNLLPFSFQSMEEEDYCHSLLQRVIVAIRARKELGIKDAALKELHNEIQELQSVIDSATASFKW